MSRHLPIAFFSTTLLVISLGAVRADIIVGYDADFGNPTVVGDIVDPTSANGGSWTLFDASLGAGDAQQGIIDGPVYAWQNLDGTANNNPGYKKTLTSTHFQSMFDDGWQFDVNMRIVQAGQFTAWGVTTGNDPGWGLTASERAGFSIGLSGDAMTVTPLGMPTAINLGAGSASAFHDMRLVGAAGGQSLRAYVDGTFYGTYQISDSGTSTSNNNILGWQSGSSTGDNREGYWNEVTLSNGSTTGPYGDTWNEVFFDNFQYSPDATGVTALGTWTVSGSTAGNASRIFTAGTGGSAMQSTGWISNATGTTITTPLGLADSDTLYSLAAILASESSSSGNLANWNVDVRIGATEATAISMFSQSGSDGGGGNGKAEAGNHQVLSFETSTVNAGDNLYLDITRTGGGAFLFVDDVAVWSQPIPEAGVLASLMALGLVPVMRRRRG